MRARGSVLPLAMLMLLAMGIIALSLSRQLKEEARGAGQLADAGLAFHLAELGLRGGEAAALRLDAELEGHAAPESWFTASCGREANPAGWRTGLCSLGLPVQARLAEGRQAVLHPCGAARQHIWQAAMAQGRCPKVMSGELAWANPHYVIELLVTAHRQDEATGRVYRITARGWGRQPESVATLQSVYWTPHGAAGRRLAWQTLPEY
ncbi:hypothetical protein [uncultured Aquitalea sp.]|uniref:pilus assembly PilX family protein n=1 Tax=uncultured Aquitalea sp. TaxID=540272 RepID=UPI0025EBB68E|nr:hypothetical protein [uncultured Aquitalea sp.]